MQQQQEMISRQWSCTVCKCIGGSLTTQLNGRLLDSSQSKVNSSSKYGSAGAGQNQHLSDVCDEYYQI